MGKILIVGGLAVLFTLLALTNPLAINLIAWANAKSAQAGYALQPASANTGTLGQFYLPAGEPVDIALYEHLNICTFYFGGEKHEVLSWRERATDNWVPGRHLSADEVRSGVMDAVRIRFATPTTAERRVCT